MIKKYFYGFSWSIVSFFCLLGTGFSLDSMQKQVADKEEKIGEKNDLRKKVKELKRVRERKEIEVALLGRQYMNIADLKIKRPELKKNIEAMWQRGQKINREIEEIDKQLRNVEEQQKPVQDEKSIQEKRKTLHERRKTLTLEKQKIDTDLNQELKNAEAESPEQDEKSKIQENDSENLENSGTFVYHGEKEEEKKESENLGTFVYHEEKEEEKKEQEFPERELQSISNLSYKTKVIIGTVTAVITGILMVKLVQKILAKQSLKTVLAVQAKTTPTNVF